MSEHDALAGLIHDLRTPLAVLAGFAELLEQRGDALSAHQRREYVARILEGAREMDIILQRARDE